METATFDPKTLKPNQVNIGTLQNPNIITSVPSKIKATNLSNGSTPFTNPVNDNTASTKLGAAVETVSNSAVLGRATPETPVQTQAPKKAVMDRMLEIIGLQKEQGQRTLDLQQEERVFEKKKLAQKLENDIISKTQAYDRQIQKVRENAGGMFGGAVEQEVARIERLKNQELADMAIQYKVAAGDYNDAFEIVQAKIDAEFEPLKNEIASLTNLYNLYQNDLTESEKIQVQANIQAKRDELDFQRQLQRDSILQKYDLAKIAYQKSMENTGGGVISPQPIKNSVTGKIEPLQFLANAVNSTGLKNNTKIQDIMGVISSTQQFANRIPATGTIPGVGSTVFTARGSMLGPQGQANVASIEAINLKVQQWASGASLTETQTKQVERLTPKAGDTNWQVRNKLNGLANFMVSQAQAEFASQGYQLPVENIDFFERKNNIVTAPDGTEVEIID